MPRARFPLNRPINSNPTRIEIMTRPTEKRQPQRGTPRNLSSRRPSSEFKGGDRGGGIGVAPSREEESEMSQEHQKNHHSPEGEKTAHPGTDRGDDLFRNVEETAEDFDAKVKKAADEIFDAADKDARHAKGKFIRVAQSEIDALKADAAEAKDRALRALAELENFRQRKNREMADDQRYASMTLARDILPVWDNLGRALEAAANDPNSEGFIDGVKMVHQQFLDVLQKNQIERIKAEGEVFNPHFHESIAMLPSEAPAGTVIIDSRPGFILHDRVVRPAQVVVAAPKPASTPTTAASPAENADAPKD